MEMAPSPYPPFDDIDFELDDNLEQFAENDGMEEEKLNDEVKDDLMKDDLMEDGSFNDNTVGYEADFIMGADNDVVGNEDDLEHPSVDEKTTDNRSNSNELAPSSNSTMAEQVEISDTFVEGEEFLFEEEEPTDHDTSNTLTHIDTDTTDPGKHEPNQSAQNEISSTILTNINEDKSTTKVVDFAAVDSATSLPKPDHIATIRDENINLRNENENGAVGAEPNNLTDEIHPVNEAIDKDISDHQQPKIAPDEPDSNYEAPNSPYQHSAATHLHPVTLRYQDQDMSLFPPLEEDDSATYFLGDPSLAFEPFDKILSACRDLLGESIGHDDEMVIDVPSLGLHICEDAKYATQITLAQVIDTYMLLSQNENLSPIKPLHCELTHRVCLSTQMAYLANSAREGKTYSAIVSEHIDGPEFDDSAVEDYAEHTAYQDELDEADGNDESDDIATADDTCGLDPTPATDNPQMFQENAELQSHHSARSSRSPKPTTFQNDSDEKVPETLAAVHSATNKSELAASQNDDVDSQLSHTLEGDQGDLAELEPESFDPEDTEFLATEEIDFALGEDDLDGNNATDLDRLTSTEQLDISQTSENKSAEYLEPEVGITSDDAGEDKIADGPVSSGALLATPSKSNGKRKLLDDDDFLEIDISTPEPKRRRPS